MNSVIVSYRYELQFRLKNRFVALLHLNLKVDIIDMVLYVDRVTFIILRFFSFVVNFSYS